MNKNMLIDLILCILLSVVIVAETIFGFNLLKSKWTADTAAVIDKSMDFGRSVGLVESVFSWPEVTYPDTNGDVVEVDENRFQVNGMTTRNSTDQKGTIFYSSADDNNVSHTLTYTEYTEKQSVDGFHNALLDYFEGDIEGLTLLLPVNTQLENITAYQQTFTDGAIPVLYDGGTEEYYMFLDCLTSYYMLHCDEPFIVSDAKVSVHYGEAGDDPLLTHAWSTYEAGAIDNTRQALADKDSVLDSYTQADLNGIGSSNSTGVVQSGGTTVDINGNQYMNQSEVTDNSALYTTPEDDAARELLVSYGTKKFNTDGSAEDGSTNIDISSTSAMASQWLLTETQYSYTDYGITINGLSGKRTSSLFEVNGHASNTISASRPWVLCVKFMGEDNALLGVKVIDNRSNPIPADGVSEFNVTLDSSDDIEFSKIVAIQFAVR